MAETTQETCPECGGPILEVVWGYPTEEDFERASRGEFILAGCCIDENTPRRSCHCGATKYLDSSMLSD